MDLSKLEDRDLITLYLKGSESAFEVILNRHKNRIFNFIVMKVKNRSLAQDIFQEAFIKIIQTLKKGKYNEEGKFLPWAMRIAHNLTIDYFRKHNKIRFVSESSSKNEDFTIFDMLELKESNVEEKLTRKELIEQMEQLIQHLPKAQRNIIDMRIYKGWSFKAIAEKEEISINTALGRMRYALINIRKLIKQHNMVTPLS